MNQKVQAIGGLKDRSQLTGDRSVSTVWQSNTTSTNEALPNWASSPKRLRILPHQVDIWRINLNPAPHLHSVGPEYLSTEEISRMEMFHFEADRRRYLVSHCGLRVILSRYLGNNPDEIRYQYSDKGKPSLMPPAGLFFNLSHSHEIALVAVAAHREIGVDVEWVRPLEDIRQLAKTCFSLSEYQAFSQAPPPHNLRVFFNGWTSKEAYIKAVGDGLSIPLDQFDVSMQPQQTSKLVCVAGHPEEAKQWTLREVPLGDEYAAAFAVRAGQVKVRFLSFFEW